MNAAHLPHSSKVLLWFFDQTGCSVWMCAWTTVCLWTRGRLLSVAFVLELIDLFLLRLLVSLFLWTTTGLAPVLRHTLIVSTRSWRCDYCITPKAHPPGSSSESNWNVCKAKVPQTGQRIGSASVVFALLVLSSTSVSYPACSVSRSWKEDCGADSMTSHGTGHAGVLRKL